jgi:hypothetical protein
MKNSGAKISRYLQNRGVGQQALGTGYKAEFCIGDDD